jgi:mannose-6-phosphate isomerase-like protein (cupin superfamily)
MVMQSTKYLSHWVAVAAVLFGFIALPGAATAASDSVFLNPADIKWGDAPPSLPKGAKVAVLYGDPSKTGTFCMRLMAPAGYKIPPHWHSQAEVLTVISGTFYLGMGDKMEPATAHALKAGGFHYLPPKEHHYAFSKGPSVVQINGEGPFDITYINAAENPQKAAKP